MDSCRTCLRTSIGPDWHDLFDPRLQPATDILNTSTSLHIAQNDGLPASVCNECYQQLTSFHAFCQQAIKSDQVQRRNALQVKEESYDNESPTKSWTLPITDPITSSAQHEYKLVDCPANADDDHNASLPNRQIPKSEDTGTGGLLADDEDMKPTLIDVDYGQDDDDMTIVIEYSDGDTDAKNDNSAECSAGRQHEYTCDLCGEQFDRKYLIKGHLRTHRGLKPFVCIVCDRLFDQFDSLRRHRDRKQCGGANRTAKAEPSEASERFVCDYADCGKTYKNRRSINEHTNRIHLGIKKCVESICETCGKSFQTRPNLMQHMKTHMDIDKYPFQCDICQKRFNVQYSYKIHMMRHNNIRNFPCPLCPSRMCTKPELDNHVANHNRDVPWPCAECPSVFNRKASMQRHVLKVHRGHKPYVCTECGRAFGKKWTLKNHIMRHTGEKPHACPVCDRRFVQLVTLKTHMKMHNK